MVGLVLLQGETRELHYVRIQEVGSLQPGRGFSPELNHVSTLISNFQPPELRNKLLLFISHPVCGTLLQQPERTKKGGDFSV